MNKKLMIRAEIFFVAFIIFLFLFSNSYAQVIKISADSESGFFWPYYLNIPGSVGNSSTLLVIPNNTGTGDDDPEVHDLQAYLDVVRWTEFADAIKSPLLIPTFPRPYTEWWIYTHALDRDSLLTSITELERIDLQLVAMIDDAKDRLSTMGIYIEKKVLMMGFSASAQFTSRFSIIHPSRIKAAAIGAPGYPIVPTSTWQGETLRYCVGTADLFDLTGIEFDLFSFKSIPLYFFIGSSDNNDPVDFADGFDPQDQNLINTLFGDTVISRWPKIQEVYDAVGCNSDFVIYQGAGHDFTSQMISDVQNFFKLKKIAEPDISINPSSYDFGNVNVGSFSEKIFVVSNDGNSILQVYSTDMIGDINQIYITAGGGSFSLAAGSSRDITVKFAPTYSGKKSAILRIVSNDSDHPQLDVNLTCIGKSSIGSALQLLLLDGLP